MRGQKWQPGSGQKSEGSPTWKEIKMLLSSHESKLPNLTKVCLGWHHLAPECSPWCKKPITRTASSPILKKELCRHQSFAAQPPEVALRPLKLMPGSNLWIYLCITKVEKRFSSHSPPPLSCHSLTPPLPSGACVESAGSVKTRAGLFYEPLWRGGVRRVQGKLRCACSATHLRLNWTHALIKGRAEGRLSLRALLVVRACFTALRSALLGQLTSRWRALQQGRDNWERASTTNNPPCPPPQPLSALLTVCVQKGATRKTQWIFVVSGRKHSWLCLAVLDQRAI